MVSIFKKLFGSRNANRKTVRLSDEQINDRLTELLEAAREKLRRFLLTRSVNKGSVKKTDQWSLSKNSEGLYRLESEHCSILINTEPFLIKKDGKITGLIRMSEIALNHALSRGFPEFFKRAEYIPEQDLLKELLASIPDKKDQRKSVPEQEFGSADHADRRYSIEDFLSFDNATIYQCLIRFRPNEIAHILIHASPETEAKLRQNISRRAKETIIFELESLLSPGAHSDLNPRSKNYSLLEFDRFMIEFQRVLKENRLPVRRSFD